MAGIITNDVTSENLDVWGVKGAEYTVNGTTVDFQDLMVAVAGQRAAVVESEIEPMSTRMRNRNKRLEELGNALSDLSGIETEFGSDDNPKPQSISSSKTREVLDTIQENLYSGKNDNYTITKANCEKAIQLVKTQIDKLNNEASADMTRLQALVDRRDESYTTATSLMQSVADTRSSLIKNL